MSVINLTHNLKYYRIKSVHRSFCKVHIMANRQETQTMLDLTCAMWDDPHVFFYQNGECAPQGTQSVFLAGPSSREDVLEYKWRSLAVHYLRKHGYTAIIYVPEPRENDWRFKETFEGEIVAWESARLLSASIACVWLPRHQTQLPGRLTNAELGVLIGMALASPEKFKKRVVFGHPPNAQKVKSEVHWADLANIQPVYDLEKMCQKICIKLATGDY